MDWDFKTLWLTVIIMLVLFLIQRSTVGVAAKSSEKLQSAIFNNEYKLLPYYNSAREELNNVKSKLHPLEP